MKVGVKYGNQEVKDEYVDRKVIDQKQESIAHCIQRKPLKIRPKVITLDRLEKAFKEGKRSWTLILDGHLAADQHSIYEVGVYSIKYYTFGDSKWNSLPKAGLEDIAINNVVLFHGDCYIIGFDISTKTEPQHLYRYNRLQCIWEYIAKLNYGRWQCGTATVGKYIYAIGGYNASTNRSLRSIERFDPETKIWSPMNPMKYENSSPLVVSLSYHIYVLCRNDNSSEYKMTMECFNTKNGKWRICADLECDDLIGVAAVGKYIYSLGIKNVQKYDPMMDNWTFCPEIEFQLKGNQKCFFTW